MILLIDAGNTRIKWAVSSDQLDGITVSGVIDDDDWSELIAYVGKFESVWLSCVASEQVRNSILSKVESLFGLKAELATVTASAAGMLNSYDDLARLGVDRWVAALGARSIFSQGDLIIIDAGTAVTIDLVSAKNRFEGGAILPGFAIMHDALLGRTAGIQSQLQMVDSVVGKNTRDCVNSGVQYGLLGAIERVVAEMSTLVGASGGGAGAAPKLLIMGGDAAEIVAGSKLDFELHSDMIFYGLMILSKT
ncbi:MAG: type III pantothenate kinase [Arenicella sp.]|jgi:type III pantothenate kinase